MKKTVVVLSLVALSGIFLSSFSNKKKQDLSINTKISSIEWIGKKVTGQHTGAINIKEGSLQIIDGVVKTGKVVIDMNSITNTDLEGEWKQKLIGHLNSEDFFDVKNYATSTLEITDVKKIDGNKYTINGKLTIKGITKPIEFPATIEIKNGKLAAFAEVNIDRTAYDIKYGSGKFFEGLGDKMIDDEFVVKFKIAAQ